jgi:hypothetical protein
VIDRQLTRRTLFSLAIGSALGLAATPATAKTAPAWSYPVARNGGLPGEGFFIKHGFACENPTYYPGLSHTGENWYAVTGNASGADVLAVADGEVVYADYDYPGRVVILSHGPNLYSMYGHLDPAIAVEIGQSVQRGQRISAVLARSDDLNRSHLHFEIRTFLIEDIVNGDHPSYGFTCGFQCPPGPGYWPLDAPQDVADLGWLNPTHAIARRMFPDGAGTAGATVTVPASTSSPRTQTWNDLPFRSGARQVGELALEPGQSFPLLQVAAGPDASHGRNAKAYRLWYRIKQRNSERVWVRAAVPSTIDRGLDGEPSSVLLDFLPTVAKS